MKSNTPEKNVGNFSNDPGKIEISGTEKGENHPLRIPGFIKEEVGLGDVIKRITYVAGIKSCGGCQRRAAALNRWLVFTPRRSR